MGESEGAFVGASDVGSTVGSIVGLVVGSRVRGHSALFEPP